MTEWQDGRLAKMTGRQVSRKAGWHYGSMDGWQDGRIAG
jgi:hypothetical protein